MRCVYVALGGNLGNVKHAFIAARNQIGSLPATLITGSSKLYRTPPIGPTGQPDYLNAVVALETELEPIALLDALQAIEHSHGRERKERWGARTLDLDIVAIDDETIASERLSIPHPHMFERQFVLQPLCDLEPQWQHPVLMRTATELLQELLAGGEEELPRGEAW